MSEMMLERMADAIEEWSKPYDGPFDRKDFLQAARATLEAMKEHSPEQEKRMRVVLGENTPATRRWHWVWYEMVDAALTQS